MRRISSAHRLGRLDLPLPLQCGQSMYPDRFSDGRIRCRVISMMPNCEIRRIFVRAPVARIASRSALDVAAVLLVAHVDEVVDHHPAQVAQPQLPGDLAGGVQVHLVGGLLGVVVGPEVAAVHVDRHQRSVCSITMEPPLGSGTFFCWMRWISSSTPYLWNSGSLPRRT